MFVPLETAFEYCSADQQTEEIAGKLTGTVTSGVQRSSLQCLLTGRREKLLLGEFLNPTFLIKGKCPFEKEGTHKGHFRSFAEQGRGSGPQDPLGARLMC